MPETTRAENSTAHLLFAEAAVEALDATKTHPAKFKRLLQRSSLPEMVNGRRVVIKMHLGSDIGFTTIHPLFVRILIGEIRNAGASSVAVIDGNPPANGIPRGLTEETLGAPVRSCFGPGGNEFAPQPIGFGSLDEVLFGQTALDADVFVSLAHVKGHGACGFGGALKNIAMGTVPVQSRQKMHRLEGGHIYDAKKCSFCLKCFRSCPNNAIQVNREQRSISFFHHHCTYCQHCVLACPEAAIVMSERKFEDFARGMAMVTNAFLDRYAADRAFFINVLANITMYCDCWGFSSPSLVPDIGILAGQDLAAVDTASLDLIRTENLLPNGLPRNRSALGPGGHLFEKIHGKNPYLMLEYLREARPSALRYEMETVA
jgi:uncharacterized Fe-S center protein